MILHGYYRSSAAWRVRIALGLKGLAATQVPHHLRRGEQRAEGYLAVNPQGLLPALVTDDGVVLTQSLAIIEWLEERQPAPSLLPGDAFLRARIRAFALAIACDIHPLQNLKVLARLRDAGVNEADVQAWARDAIGEGLAAAQKLLPVAGPFCFGATPTLADLCLVPQLFNARRFGVDLAPLSRLLEAEAACNAIPAFQAAVPEKQADAE